MSNPIENTRTFYEENAESFIARTVHVDMSHHYKHFLKSIPAGGRVLDAGCGSGRDTLAFKKLGYHLDAFDASSEMVKSARDLTGVDVQQNTFQNFTSAAIYDGIWAYASLLHVPYVELPLVLSKLAAALKNNAPLFASFKLGEGEVTREDGRRFSMMNEERFRALLAEVPELKLENIRIVDSTKKITPAEKWLCVLLSKRN
ncbi:Methyltransferase domain-containing protein [Pseudovibrio sp. Tun.PSC04-5.I4]|nr:Methyltransferase domain-containing protein [Pseudovibrio sp. Tun.PSC04-5.I4]